MKVFLGITGASGAPYASRLLQSLAAADCEVGVSVSGAAIEVSSPHDVPERFNLVFKADDTHIPCHVVWRQEDRIGVAFD